MYLEDLAAAARAVRQGLTTSRALVEASLARHAEVEPTVHAFAHFDPERALRLANEADAAVRARGELGLLHGVPIGVKDIFDTAGIPTENGSALFAGRVPAHSAAAVIAVERAGAIVVGKTVTSELAFYHPGPTRNPHDPSRTPGGSSMGSAAGVAAGMIPAAIGSQTNGSIIRPAAFCGVVGSKPTYGRISRDGVMPFAPTLDHVGGFARTVESVAWLTAALAGEPLEHWWTGPLPGPPRFAAVRTSDWERASEPMRERFQRAVDALASAGRAVEWPSLPEGLDDGVAVLGTIMRVEGARSLVRYVKESPEEVSLVARRFFAEGERIPEADYRRALAERDRLIAAFAAWAAPYDAVLTLPAMGEAPGPETTGDPIFCTRWTLVGAPAVTIPIGKGPSGLPLGLQLVGAPGDDTRLFGASAWAEKIVSGW
jgi:Asp-tRNA(Asn)/Glu-tRNA(Gln) amidotransferase A subunit family amidase